MSECVLIVHAGAEWKPPKRLDANIRRRTQMIDPDSVCSLYLTDLYEVPGRDTEHLYSKNGELLEMQAAMATDHKRVHLMGGEMNRCHLRAFKSIVHSYTLREKSGSVSIPFDCVYWKGGGKKGLASKRRGLDEWKKYVDFVRERFDGVEIGDGTNTSLDIGLGNPASVLDLVARSEPDTAVPWFMDSRDGFMGM